MIYCISDIHGEVNPFREMLSLIQFSEEDTLYILGDASDRKADGVEVLKIIMASPNVVMLLGNHEQMCLDFFAPNSGYEERELWHQNGGNITRRQLLYFYPSEDRHRILRFLSSLPDQMDIEVKGQKYHLVHGIPSDNHQTRIWGRPESNDAPFFQDKTVIIGHTPTYLLTDDYEHPARIWYGNGSIDIDCGSGHRLPVARLACLRLDDMKEFYV